MTFPHIQGAMQPVSPQNRNPRRSYDLEGYEITPMTLQEAMNNGVAALRTICECGHQAEVPISVGGWPAVSFVPDAGLTIRCSACGRSDPMTVPAWPRKIGPFDSK